MTAYPEKKFQARTIEVNYAEGPDNGPPLLLIHGLGGHWANWEPVIDQFAEDWHVYAIDLRGHGDSGWDAGGRYDFASLVRDVEAVTAAPRRTLS